MHAKANQQASPTRICGPDRYDQVALIEMVDISKVFKSPAGEFTVLKDINACFYPGEFVSVVGRSGSGKSTLVNILTGIDHPICGSVRIMDAYPHKMSESRMAVWRGYNLGIVFQFFQLLPMLTLLENVMLAMDFAEMYDFDERPARAMEILKLVGLESIANKLPILVSTGQQQLAAIARALACDPPLLVADEPTGNLDTKSANTIIDLFEELSRRCKTVVMVTHDPSLTSRTTRNVIISDGELINETIAKALPWLRHRHMLEFTRLAQTRTYPANAIILSQNEPVEQLFMIQSGEADVLVQDRRKKETVLSRLKPGDFFGENEVLNGK